LRPESTFELVVICTGNRARSPVAEGFLRMLLADLPVRVRSHGILELDGASVLPEALEAASPLGLDLSAHRASTLKGGDLSRSDLVLGFERSHVAAAVVEGGAPRERVFSLPELVELIEGAPQVSESDPITRARAIIADADARRVRGAPPAEVADPIGRDPAFFRATVERVRDLTIRVATGLFGPENVRSLSP
jgi:protein-tyrosine phosphatase